MVLRWGIVSAGKIAHDFVCALRVLPRENHEVVAIAASALEKAQNFAEKHGIGESYAGYEDIAKHPNVDIVYIGVIHPYHYNVAKMMIDHGKHVLCEKPLTMSKKHTKDLLEYAQSKGCFFMEAIWSRSFPAYKKLAEIIESGVLGDIKFVNANFGVPLDVDRVILKELGGGGILDLGVYTMQFCLYVFRNLKVEKFIGSGLLNECEVDNFASCIVHFEGNRMATLTVCTENLLPNEAVIVGTKGILKVPKFWAPTQLIMPDGNVLEFPLPETIKDMSFNFQNSVGLSYEAEECRKCIEKGLKESHTIPHCESIILAGLLDTWLDAVGVTYPDSN